ncbi:bacterio-opsin activator domain-containing protein [Natrinema ejinorense]|uniref:Histidine kinase n=1 Tax=Natrinema ejinorense TaxID=373386 RepID=A0A2A5QWK5_9EURY|nr:bacterio-opsin activator domain-containing protein [Natrinema ejinorense]PCR91163.1 histidine kinase [Natrinema ejinorense]
MASRQDLAAATLETLPITIAVIDDDGEIRLTNRSWREFAPESEDHLGVDYIATATTADDEHATRAVAGIERVLDGDQESFEMEYPCHSPAAKRWFMMRASRFRDGDERLVSIVHVEITERKLAEIAAEENAQQVRDERQALEHVLERVDGLVRDVTDAAVGAETRGEIEREVCARLTETDPYVLAWIGRADVTNRRLSPQEWASEGDVSLEDDELVIGTDESHPAIRAFEDGQPRVIQDLDAFDAADRWWPEGAGEHVQSLIALPLTYGEITYGVLVVFAADPEAFDERERFVLESLAETIATAMNALEVRRMLTTETVVSMAVSLEDPSLFVTALSTAVDATITYRGVTYDANGTPLVFLHADRELDAASVQDAFENGRDVEILSETESDTVLEVEAEDGLVTVLSEYGGVIQELTVTDGVADLVLELPDGRSARSAYDLLERRYDRVELDSYHETEEPARTRKDIVTRLESSLTDRQLMALRKAYYANYFEWPRDISGEELAASMDISRSTYHQHLRTAQRKLLDELLE